MLIIRNILFIITVLFVSGCSLKKPMYKNYETKASEFQFVAIPNTSSINSSTSTYYSNQYGGYGGSGVSKQLNPSSIIEGILLKKGYTSVSEITDTIKDKTLIVKYGQSGRREVFMGYTLEVTMKLISAKTMEPVFMCTAEGLGSTEVDDIREAITRCLDGLPSNF